MALEVDMHSEITAYRARVFLGMSFRQLGLVAAGLVVALPLSYAVSRWYAGTSDWQAVFQSFSERGSLVVFVVMMPFAFLGWARPYGLKPETFARYFFRHLLASKELTYGAKVDPLTSSRREVKRAERGKGRAKRSSSFPRKQARKTQVGAARAA